MKWSACCGPTRRLGLILFWWAGTVQQAGRARLTLSRLPDLTVLDSRTLTDAQHARARQIFNAFKVRPFLPANEAYHDQTRQALDEAVLVTLPGSSGVDPRSARRAPQAMVRRADRARRQGDPADVIPRYAVKGGMTLSSTLHAHVKPLFSKRRNKRVASDR